MIHGLYYHGDDHVATRLSIRHIEAARTDPAGVLWVDLEAPDPAAARDLLTNVFAFHPLAVADCLDDEQRPKLEDFGSHIFVVVRTPRPTDADADRRAHEVDLFLGPNYLVTYHDSVSPALARLREEAAADARILAEGADLLAARCLQLLGEEAIDTLDRVDDELEGLEEAVFGDRGAATLGQLFRLRHELAAIHRVLGPQRDVLNRLAWDRLAPIRPDSRLYFREAYDQLLQIIDLVDARRDLASSAVETYLSVASNRLNETMRLLTALQMVFLPLTLIASVYGMNFRGLPPLPDGWRIVLLAMVGVGVAQIVAFRRLRWI